MLPASQEQPTPAVLLRWWNSNLWIAQDSCVLTEILNLPNRSEWISRIGYKVAKHFSQKSNLCKSGSQLLPKKKIVIINQMSGGISSPYLPLFPAHYFFIRLITSRSETRALTHEGPEGRKLSNGVRSSWTDWREMQRGERGDNRRDGFPGAPHWKWQDPAPLAHAQLCTASASQLHWKYDFPVCQTLNPKGIYWYPSGKTLNKQRPANNIGLFYNHSTVREQVLPQLKPIYIRSVVLCSHPTLHVCAFLSPSSYSWHRIIES